MSTPQTGWRPPGSMHVVAVQRSGPPPDDAWIQARAESVGLTFYEVRARLRVLDGWPGVLSTVPGLERAEAVAATLDREGIPAWVLPGEWSEPRARVRQFSLAGGRLWATVEGGAPVEIPTHDVRMLVRGVRLSERREYTAVRPMVTPVARAALWAVSTMQRPQLRVHASREPFVELYAPGRPILSFEAGALRYAALEGTVEPTRTANFRRVIEVLRSGCPRATYDERLRGRIEQVRVLGPTLRPEKHLALAVALITGRRRTSSPYR